MAKHGLHPPVNDPWGPGGTAYLDSLELDDGYHIRVESLRDLVALFDREVAMLESSTGACATTAATGPSRPLTASAGSWRPCS